MVHIIHYTNNIQHYYDVIMGAMASQITSLTIVYSTVYSSADRRKHQSSPSLAFVRGIHRRPVNSPHKGPVTRKIFPFDDVIMKHHITQHYCSSLPSISYWCHASARSCTAVGLHIFANLLSYVALWSHDVSSCIKCLKIKSKISSVCSCRFNRQNVNFMSSYDQCLIYALPDLWCYS